MSINKDRLDVIYIPQFSFFDIDGTCIVENDSNMQCMNTMFKYLQALQKANNDSFTIYIKVFVPLSIYRVTENNKYFASLQISTFIFNVSFAVYNDTVKVNNAYLQRFIFEGKNVISDYLQALRYYDTYYTLIINNIPEITTDLKVLLDIKKISNYKILSINHFPVNKGVVKYDYYYRQEESIHSSDFTFFNHVSNLRNFIESRNYSLGELVYSKMEGVNFFDISIFNTKIVVPPKNENIKSYLFPSRITENNYTGWIEAIELVKTIAKNDKHYKHVIVFLNPTKEYSAPLFTNYMRGSYPSIHKYENGCIIYESVLHNTEICYYSKGVSKNTYYAIAKTCEYVFSLYTQEAYGGLAIRECIAINPDIIPIVHNVHAFREVSRHDYPITSNLLSTDNILQYIKYAKDFAKIFNSRLLSLDSWESTKDKVVNILKTLITKD